MPYTIHDYLADIEDWDDCEPSPESDPQSPLFIASEDA